MGSTRGIAFLLFFSIFSIVDSQDCAVARLSANDVLETVQIYSNAYAITDEHVTFEIASSPPSNSFDQVSDSIRILTNNQSSCPGACTVTLNRYTDTSPGAQTNVLFFDTDHAFYLPSHYVKDNKTTFVCVANNGACGATVPIYRYYTLSNGAVFHAYSFDQDVTNYGYNQEFFPICYAWAIPSGTVASRPSCGSLNFDIPPETLSNMNIYDNNMSGIERDHYYTTLPSTDPSLASYNQTGVIGKVLTSSKSTACSCLVKLQQQFDNQTGYFHRLDHKLIVTGQEPNRPYEEYMDTGETVYCSKRLGDCGATLPLWKHFQFYDVDTVYTTDSSPLPMSYLYPQTPLCYIWPVTYSPNVSNIVTGAPAPPVGGTTQLPGVTDSTVTPSATPGTSSTRLSDGGTVGPSTVVSSVTVSTPASIPSTISALGSTTTTTSNPLSIGSVSTISTSSASTLSSLGTTISTQATSQSTVSVWGTGIPATMSSIATSPTVSTTLNPTNPNSQSTLSTWSSGSPPTPITVTTITPSTAGAVSTISPATFATSTMMTPSTVSVWGTPALLGTTATASTVSTATQTSSVTGSTSATTTHLADSGGITPVIVIPINASHTMPTTPEYPVTAGEEVTEANLETEVPLEEDFNPTPETFTLSNFLSITTTTSSSVGSIGTPTPTVSQSIATSAGTVQPETTGTSSASLTPTLPGITLAAPANPITNSTGIASESTSHSPVTSENTTITTRAAPVFVTGPLIFNIPTAPPQTTELPTPTNSTLSVSSTSTIPIATPPPSTVATGSTMSHDASPATPTPQHVAQSVPTYSIVGGALDSFTNPPIIAALISSSAGSTPAPTQSQPTSSGITLIVPTVYVTNSTGSMNPISSESTTHSTIPVLNNVPSTATMTSITTTQEPGIIWKAGDWISNTWHSVFGGNDKNLASSSTSQSSNISTTPPPIGGLVGSLINSAGNNSTSFNPISSFFNSTGNFIDQHLNSNSSEGFVNKTIDWIDNKWNNTGVFISNAWDSLHSNNQTSGSFVNNTQTWIGGAMNSTGEFLTNAWNSLADKNGTSGSFMNGTQTWIGGAVNSTGDFLSNAWNSLSSNNITGSVVNNTNSWIDGALNTTGGFLTNAWNSFSNGNGTSAAIVNDTKTRVGGAADSTGQFLSNAWNSLVSSKNETVDSTNTVTFMNTPSPQINEAVNEIPSNVSANLTERVSETNITALASAPHSNPVGSVASVILPIVNSSTSEPKDTKVEWNGGLVSGPITK